MVHPNGHLNPALNDNVQLTVRAIKRTDEDIDPDKETASGRNVQKDIFQEVVPDPATPSIDTHSDILD